MDNLTESEVQAIENFRQYLRIKTVHPNPDYDGAITWIRKQAEEIGLQFNMVRFARPAEFSLWLSWTGSDPKLKSIFLNSHIDVVPVDEAKWTKDPFAADQDDDGNIFARGSQDMKSVGVQYLEAIRNLKTNGFLPRRTIHICFVPDEELGGTKGMKEFVETQEFVNLNVGFALDEGIASPTNVFEVAFGERAIWQLKFTTSGNTGHALRFIENTAAEKLQKVINRMLEIRNAEKSRLDSNPELGMGDVTSINMTIIQGGLQINIVPSELSASFDMRVTPNWTIDETLRRLDKICEEAGPGVKYDFLFRSDHGFAQTKLSNDNPWWQSFKTTCDEMGMKLNVKVFQGATDIRYLRHKGIDALGFSPIINTPILLHDNDEFLNKNVFLIGIKIYQNLIEKLVQVAPMSGEL